MLPRTSATGTIARHLQQAYKPNTPIVLSVLFQEHFQDSRTGTGRQVTEQWLVKLWPSSFKVYNDLIARFHVGALIQVCGTVRIGSYQDQHGEWKHSPNIVVEKIAVLRKAAQVKAAEHEHIPYNVDVHYAQENDLDGSYESCEDSEQAGETPNEVVSNTDIPQVARKARGATKRNPQATVVAPNATKDTELDSDLPF